MSLQVTIEEERAVSLEAYARISSAFEVRSVLEVSIEDDLRGVSLCERGLRSPWLKDYDGIEGGPRAWPKRFDTARWFALVASAGGERVGGALLVHDDASIELLEGRSDLAVLWDLRVAPGHRGRGVGTQLFRAAEDWARERGCRELKVETQNVNVTACRFYARMGCRLGALDRFAYPDLPGEVQLLWFKTL